MIQGTIYRSSVVEAVIRGLGTDLGYGIPSKLVRVQRMPVIELRREDWSRVAIEGRDGLLAIVTRECIDLMRRGWIVEADGYDLPRNVIEPELGATIMGRMEIGPHDEGRHITSMAEFLEFFGDPSGDEGDD